MKEEINKDIEILKKNQSKMNYSISQIKISMKCLQTEWNRRQSSGISSNSKRT
jgi:hypothetical protein